MNNEIKMSELKPCPFCGGSAELEIGEIDLNGSATRDSFQYYCDNCEILKGEFDSVESAQKDWNMRTHDQHLARIAELESKETIEDNASEIIRELEFTSEIVGFSYDELMEVMPHLKQLLEQSKLNQDGE